MIMDNKTTPALTMLYFYLSSFCNCACKHCWISPRYLNARNAPDEAPYETFIAVIDQAIPLGLQEIKLTGGEPLLSTHAKSLMRYACEKNLGITMETNGVLLNEEMADFLKDVDIKNVAISIDGPDADTHETLRGVKDVFAKTADAVRLCAARDINTQVIMSLYKKNYHLIHETARYAQSLGARSIKLNCISCIERGSDLQHEDSLLNIAEYLALHDEIREKIQPSLKISILFDIPPVYNFFPKENRHPGRCGILNILGVLANGQLSICGIGTSMPDLLFGTVHEKPLAEIWSHEPVLNTIRDGLPHKLKGICGACMFKGYCLGKCRAEAYYSNQDIFAPFYFCSQADQLGLFPEKFKYRKIAKGG